MLSARRLAASSPARAMLIVAHRFCTKQHPAGPSRLLSLSGLAHDEGHLSDCRLTAWLTRRQSHRSAGSSRLRADEYAHRNQRKSNLEEISDVPGQADCRLPRSLRASRHLFRGSLLVATEPLRVPLTSAKGESGHQIQASRQSHLTCCWRPDSSSKAIKHS